MEKANSNLQNRKGNGIVGVNIGKNKNTPAEEAVIDYLKCFEKLYSVADYFTVNVSSPNTPGLRSLQEKGPLNEIIKALMLARSTKEKLKPVFLKIAPDLNWAEVDDVIEIALENNLAGIIATNTTISRENLGTSISEIEKIGAGGLSGRPLNHLSTAIVEYISKQTNQKLGIIASGGIMSPSHAMQKIDAGATLVQLYTGFVYKGPKLIADCRKQLMNNL
jgi:dihydroorotate dehydrogenase